MSKKGGVTVVRETRLRVRLSKKELVDLAIRHLREKDEETNLVGPMECVPVWDMADVHKRQLVGLEVVFDCEEKKL